MIARERERERECKFRYITYVTTKTTARCRENKRTGRDYPAKRQGGIRDNSGVWVR